MGEANGRIAQERKEFRESQEAETRKRIEERKQKIVQDVKRTYDGIQALLPEINKDAASAIRFLRREVKRVKRSWQAKLEDHRLPENERNVLIGQINSVELAFSILYNAVELTEKLNADKDGSLLMTLATQGYRGGK